MTRARGTLPDSEVVGDADRVHGFAEMARGFLALLSRPGPEELADRARSLAHACAGLYAAASELADIDVDEAEAVEEIPDTMLELAVTPDWTEIGAAPTYQLLIDPFADDDPAIASLNDDLEEVLAELAAGLVIYDESPDHWRAAAIEWRMDFFAGWGRHLAAVLYAAHCALAVHREPLDP